MFISSMETKQHWSVHVAPVQGELEDGEALAFAWTQIGRYGKWRLFCIDTLVLLESVSIDFWDLKSKTTWHAVGVFVP